MRVKVKRDNFKYFTGATIEFSKNECIEFSRISVLLEEELKSLKERRKDKDTEEYKEFFRDTFEDMYPGNISMEDAMNRELQRLDKDILMIGKMVEAINRE